MINAAEIIRVIETTQTYMKHTVKAITGLRNIIQVLRTAREFGTDVIMFDLKSKNIWLAEAQNVYKVTQKKRTLVRALAITAVTKWHGNLGKLRQSGTNRVSLTHTC